MRRTFILANPLVRRQAAAAIQAAPQGYAVTVAPASRSTQQNALMWALLTEVSRQVEWAGRYLQPDDWKTLFSALLRKQEVVPGLDGGFVVLGVSTRDLTKGQFGDLLDLILAWCRHEGVEVGAEISPEWDERSQGAHSASEGHREVAA